MPRTPLRERTSIDTVTTETVSESSLEGQLPPVLDSKPSGLDNHPPLIEKPTHETRLPQ